MTDIKSSNNKVVSDKICVTETRIKDYIRVASSFSRYKVSFAEREMKGERKKMGSKS